MDSEVVVMVICVEGQRRCMGFVLQQDVFAIMGGKEGGLDFKNVDFV